MLDRRECYCQLLGLNPLRASKYGDEALEAAIDAAEEEWRKSSRTTDPTVRFKASKYLEEVPEMRATMKDPERRRLEFEAARRLLEGRLQGIRRQGVILSDGSIHVFPDVISKQLAVLRWKGVTEADVKAITGVKSTPPPSPVGSKVQNAYKAMAKVGAYTPAELFNALIDRPDLKIECHPLNDASGFALAESTLKTCEGRVNNIKLPDFPEQDAYIMCIRTVKLAFANESDYAELVRFGKCNRDLAPVMDVLETEYSARLGREDIDRILELQHAKIDLDMAIPILQIFCYSRRIPANFSESDSSMIRCPDCWNLIAADDETAFCPSCGSSIRVTCPSCGSKQLTKNRTCSTCGFDFKNGKENAKRLERSFKASIAKGRIDAAASDLEEIKASCSGLLETAVLASKLSEARKKFSAYIGIIDDAYARRRYYDAKSSCESLNAVYPDILADNPDLRHKYEDSLKRYEEAERICRATDGLDSEDKKLACYINAADICPDHPEARSKLREHPPQCPTDSEACPKNDVVSIKFSPPADTKGVTYCIYRQEGSIPRVDESTVPLVETSKCSFEDTTPEPGVNYYYVLCSKRWGILSRNKELIGPVMVLTEVGNVKIDATEEGFRLSYDKPKKASRVRIWRRKKDDESEYTELDVKGADVYEDVCLGGTSYYYLFIAEYDINGRPVRSEGLEYSASSMKMPEPVNNLDIRRDRSDGTYLASWSSNYDVTLYYSTKKLRFGNRIMKTEDVKSWMTEIKPVNVYTDRIRFAMEDGAVWYIYPIIQRGKTCVRGDEARVSNLIPFRDVEKSVVNRECVITMNWPKFAVEAEFRISNNEPKDPEDPDLEIKTVKREEYEENRHVRIPMGNSPRKFVYIYAMYRVEDEMVPSRPIMISVYSVECRKVRYAASKSKRNLTFEFSADRDVPEIPPVMAVQSSERIPLRAGDGEVIWRSGGPVKLTDGSASVTVNCSPAVDIERVRLFFEEEADYNLFKFIHPLYRRRRDGREKEGKGEREHLRVPVLLQQVHHGQGPQRLHRDVLRQELRQQARPRRRMPVPVDGQAGRDRLREDGVPRQGPEGRACDHSEAPHHTRLVDGLRHVRAGDVHPPVPHLPQRDPGRGGGGRQQDLRDTRPQGGRQEPLHGGPHQPDKDLRRQRVQRRVQPGQRHDHAPLQGALQEAPVRRQGEAAPHPAVRRARGRQGAPGVLPEHVRRGQAQGVHLRVHRHRRGGPGDRGDHRAEQPRRPHIRGRRDRLPGGPAPDEVREGPHTHRQPASGGGRHLGDAEQHLQHNPQAEAGAEAQGPDRHTARGEHNQMRRAAEIPRGRRGGQDPLLARVGGAHPQGDRDLRRGELRADRRGARGIPQKDCRGGLHTDCERVRRALLFRGVRPREQPHGERPAARDNADESGGPLHLAPQQERNGMTGEKENKLMSFIKGGLRTSDVQDPEAAPVPETEEAAPSAREDALAEALAGIGEELGSISAELAETRREAASRDAGLEQVKAALADIGERLSALSEGIRRDEPPEQDEGLRTVLSDIGERLESISAEQKEIRQESVSHMTSREQMKTILAAVERRDAEVTDKAFLRTMEQVATMREDFHKLCAGVRGKLDTLNAEEVLSSFEAYSVDLENILCDGGVYIGPFPYDKINTMHQRIVGIVPTGDPELNGMVAERESDGYKLGNRVLLKEKVSIYKLAESLRAKADSETPSEDKTQEDQQ